MQKEEFYEVVSKLIVPLFTGSVLAGEVESSARDLEVALGKGNSILLKPNKSDDYRLVLRRGQAFKSFEVNIIRSIIHELFEISALQIKDKLYLQSLQNMAIEKALIESITDNGAQTILGIITSLEKWASRTYEGATVDLGIMVNLGVNADSTNPVKYSEVINKDFFALVTDGINSFVEFDKNGLMLGYLNLKNPKSVPTICPYVFDKVARVCNDKRVGIVLTQKGDILIFYARQLVFAKRNGSWCVYSHEEVIRLLYNNVSYTAKEIRRSIYNSALDCSFAYKGACLAYINKDKTEQALAHINAADIISEEHFNIKREMELAEADKLYNIGNAKKIVEKFNMSYEEFLDKHNYKKTMAIRKIIAGKKLFELDRKLIEEMTSIDGATIVDYDGTIIAIGAIIKIEAGSQGGGRLAATSTMAKYGVAIKVSQDGIMQGFGVDKQGKVKQLFNVG
ncbi:MAG: hypothetical protein E7375_01410 [Clostridiales bacterium]|nr:hypothetical protein [Clostridiales bacterium]